MPDGMDEELQEKVKLHSGYKGILELMKQRDESDEEQDGRSVC